MTPTFFPAWDGLGDNIYLRPVVEALAETRELWVRTPWPDLYEDLGVHFVRARSELRTQAENEARQPDDFWSEPPPGAETMEPYILHGSTTVMEGTCSRLPVRVGQLSFSLPDFGRSLRFPEPYALVRPVTVRREFEAPARNPRAEYVAQAAEIARAAGLAIVSVAHLEPGEEWAVEPLPKADVRLHHGELTIRGLMMAVAGAALTIGGPGWILPASVAYRRPLLVVGGGRGGYDDPKRLLCPPMDGSRVRWMLPDDFCRCRRNDHDCPKHISGFGGRAEAHIEELLAA